MNTQVLSDRVLLNSYLSGDCAAISKLIDRHSRRVRDYIRMMVKDTDKGKRLTTTIQDLRKLLVAYRSGLIKEKE
jgi:fructose-1,6-bisphosphatase